tara:strand:+ start:560 stop:1045 length:486 start_codon:yes stop_codon:yes gene_type:complete
MKIVDNVNKINDLLKNNDNTIIILLFADWCGACQHFKPTWNSTIEKMKDTPNLLTANVESNNFENLDIDTGNIMGYPTVEVHKGGKKIDGFVGGKSEEQLMNFFNKYLKQTGGKRKSKKSKKSQRKLKRKTRKSKKPKRKTRKSKKTKRKPKRKSKRKTRR